MSDRRLFTRIDAVVARGTDVLGFVRSLLTAAGLMETPVDLKLADDGVAEAFVNAPLTDDAVARMWRAARSDYITIIVWCAPQPEITEPPPDVPWWHTANEGDAVAPAIDGAKVHRGIAGTVWGSLPLSHTGLQYWGFDGLWVRVLKPTQNYPNGLWMLGQDLKRV